MLMFRTCAISVAPRNPLDRHRVKASSTRWCRALVAESLLLKHQLLIINRSCERAPNLRALDRFVLGLATVFMRPRRVSRLAAILKPVTLFKFHKALVQRKYSLLFS